MKKIILLTTIVLLACFIFANKVNASGTTCTISLSAPSGHGYTYEIRFRIWDNWYPAGWHTGWSNWVSIDPGTTYNFPIPLDVIPDCNDRWIVYAQVRQFYNGNLTGQTDVDSQGPMSSDGYYSGNIMFSLTIP